MGTSRWTQQLSLLFGVCGAAVCMLSCVAQPYRTSSRTVLRDGYAREPGSFCALNPEGCPPPSAAPSAEPGTFDLAGCLEACEAGGAALEHYCRGLPKPWQKQICWSVVGATKTMCRGMCYRVNACSTSASEDCPEREE